MKYEICWLKGQFGMRSNRQYPPIRRQDFCGMTHVNGTGKTLIDMVESLLKHCDYRIQKKGKEVYDSGCVLNVSCKYGRVFSSEFSTITVGYTPAIIFNSQVRGSENNTYDIRLRFLKQEGNFLYECTCPHCNKVPGKQICKHIYATLLWIRENYVFDRNNYELEPIPVDQDKAKIKMYNFEVTQRLICTFESLTHYLYLEAITKLRLYEKACRFLEKGLLSIDDNISFWSDIYCRNEFKSMGLDFNSYMNKFLYPTDLMVNRGRTYDKYFFSQEKSEGKYNENEFITFKQRVDKIDESIAINPFQVASLEELQRVFDTYSRITKFKISDYVFNGKYIYVPNYYEMIILEAKDVPSVFYNNFKLGNQTLKDGIFYQVNSKIYILLCNYFKGYKPWEWKDENY